MLKDGCTLRQIIQQAFLRKMDATVTEFKTLLKRQISQQPKYKEYYKKQKFASNLKKEAELGTHVIKDLLTKNFTEEKINLESFTKHILDTNYQKIYGLTKEELEAEQKANPWLKQFDNEIAKYASALNNKSNETGFFQNNSIGLLKDHGYYKNIDEMAEILDRTISYKAMTPESWKFVSDIKNTKTLSDAIAILQTMEEKSKQLFKNNPEFQTRGYLKEVYNEIDFNPKNIDGILPNPSQNLKVGQTIPIPFYIQSGAKEAMEEWAKRNNVKITRTEARKIATYEWKLANGLSRNPIDIITATYSSIEHKLNANKVIEDIRKDLSKSELFSTDKKEGFVEITNPKTKEMLKGTNINYVDEELEKQLLGRKQVSLTDENSKEWKKKTDVLVKELVILTKQNKVLHNLSSLKNLVLMNATVSISAGVSPKKVVRNTHIITKQWTEIKNLEKKMMEYKAKGKDTKQIEKKLNTIPLYQAKQNGLIVSNTDGSEGSIKYINQLADKAWRNIPSPILEPKTKGIKGKTRAVLSNIVMTPSSTMGKLSQGWFSKYDSVGRYSIYEKEISKGTSPKEAARIANSYFADMEHIAPAIVDLLDQYPFIPFFKWFTESIGGTIKLYKDNPVKAFGTTAVLYAISSSINISDTGYNQAESIIDFGGELLATPANVKNIFSTDVSGEQWQRAIAPTLLPATEYKILFKMAQKKHMKMSDYLHTLFPKYPAEDWKKVIGKDIRGTTQTLVESMGIVEKKTSRSKSIFEKSS